MKLRSGIYISILWLVSSIVLVVQMHFFTSDEIIGMSIHDEHPDAVLEKMRSDMHGSYKKLVWRRDSILDYLEKTSK